MKGKERCRALKEIRRQIAENNDIEYAVSECTYQGECKGVCPKCEAELKYLERELEKRRKLGKTIAIAGIAASVCTGLTACSPKSITSIFHPEPYVDDIAGGMAEPIEVIEGDVTKPYNPAEDDNGMTGIDGESVPDDSSCAPDDGNDCGNTDGENPSVPDGDIEANIEGGLMEIDPADGDEGSGEETVVIEELAGDVAYEGEE